VSAITSKERNMLLITMVLVLYAVAFLFYRKQTQNWQKHKRIYQSAREKYNTERDLIAARDEWDAKYVEMRSLMPVFPYDKDVDTHWLNLMDTVAGNNKLAISRRQTGKEEEVGDVYELPIVCNNWEGTLEALVRFLYGLHDRGAMLDVRQLYVRPGSDAGYLKGTFTLYCAYMRGDETEVEHVQATAEGMSQPDEDGQPVSAVTEESVMPPPDSGTPLPEGQEMPDPSSAERTNGVVAEAGESELSDADADQSEASEVKQKDAVKAAVDALQQRSVRPQ
jgi:hypothetical protein